MTESAPIRISERGRAFVVEGRNIGFARLKAEVAKTLGEGGVQTEAPGKFAFPREAAPAVGRLLAQHGYHSSALRQEVQSGEAHGRAREKVLRLAFGDDEADIPAAWESILQPHQKKVAAAMSVPGLRGLCLFDEQGAGKTVTTIAAFDLLRESGEIQRACVVCPKSMLGEWEKSFGEFTPGKYRLAVLGGNARKSADMLGEKPDVCVLNYETVRAMLTRLLAFAKSAPCLLVADESYHVKNPAARRSEVLRRLRDGCRRAFVLCGTPAPNRPDDLINQVNLADNGHTFQGRKPTNDRARDSELIYRAIDERGTIIRRLKNEILPNLARKKFIPRKIPMVGAQNALYQRARGDFALYLRDMNNEMFMKNIRDYFARRATLLQICACPASVDMGFVGDHAKTRHLDNALAQLVEAEGRKVVVWSSYRLSIDEISHRYRNYGVVRVDGKTPAAERREAVRRFQEDGRVNIFVGNPAAAGAGITLHKSADSIFVSYPGQSAHFQQALDRIHRIGQSAEEVRYHLLVCQDTIEENAVRLLREKALQQHQLLDAGKPWPSSLDEALMELEGGE